MNNMPIVERYKRKSILKLIQIAGLAFSIPFELAAGPFIGYFIGTFLKDKFGMHRYIIYSFIIIGFIASVVNIMITIKMMLVINKEKSGRLTNAED